jgi:hypothetical protein
MKPLSDLRPSQTQLGIGVGSLFCAMTVVNGVVGGTKTAQLFSADGAGLDSRTITFVYFTVGAAILLHVAVWFVYAALVGIASRFVFADGDDSVPFATLFAAAGAAQLPLLIWAACIGVTWVFWSPASSSQFLSVVKIQYGTRYVAYMCALVVMTAAVAALYRARTSAAIVATWTPALALWLVSVLMQATGAIASYGP